MKKHLQKTKQMPENLFLGACDFYRAASEAEHFPPDDVKQLPEIAFWGRSNVGKSSLINALTGRKALARTSNTPGRTQQIIFFNLSDHIMIADLPGYGHAEAPKHIIKQWTQLIDHYLSTRTQIKCVYVLVDSRHGFLKKDLEAMHYLDQHAVLYQVILTKTDYLSAVARDKLEKETIEALKKHPAARPEIFSVSAEKNIGIELLRETILSHIA